MTNTNKITLRFEPGSASVDEIDQEISAVFKEIFDRGQSGTQRDDLSSLAAGSVIVHEDGKGFGDAVLILIEFITGASVHMVDKAWDELIWPRIKARLGADALGERSDDSADDSEESDN